MSFARINTSARHERITSAFACTRIGASRSSVVQSGARKGDCLLLAPGQDSPRAGRVSAHPSTNSNAAQRGFDLHRVSIPAAGSLLIDSTGELREGWKTGDGDSETLALRGAA